MYSRIGHIPGSILKGLGFHEYIFLSLLLFSICHMLDKDVRWVLTCHGYEELYVCDFLENFGVLEFQDFC